MSIILDHSGKNRDPFFNAIFFSKMRKEDFEAILEGEFWIGRYYNENSKNDQHSFQFNGQMRFYESVIATHRFKKRVAICRTMGETAAEKVI